MLYTNYTVFSSQRLAAMDSALDDLALLLQHTESYDRFVKHLVEVSSTGHTVPLCASILYNMTFDASLQDKHKINNQIVSIEFQSCSTMCTYVFEFESLIVQLHNDYIQLRYVCAFNGGLNV
jgi:hypothetical protein